jgi:hypothetical protein
MLMAGGTSTFTKQYGTPEAVVPVDTEVMVADESFGGLVVGNVGRSEISFTLPMPAASHVSSGAVFTAAASGTAVVASAPAVVDEEAASEPPPPQPTKATAPTNEVAKSIAVEGRRDRISDMDVSFMSLQAQAQ